MGIRDKVRTMGSRAVTKGIDLVAKRLFGKDGQRWSEEERAHGIVQLGSSRTAFDQASRLAEQAGYEVKEYVEPSTGITRPRAGRTTGARFEDYPLLAPTGALPPKGSEAAWDLSEPLRPHLEAGLREYKETLLLALTAIDSPEAEALEDQLLELHPVIEPQCIVVFARLGNLEQERLYRRVKLGELVLTLPHVPMLFVLHLDRDGTLSYKALALGRLNGAAPRFGIVSLLDGETWLPEGATGVLEMTVGKTRHRSSAADRYARKWSTKIPLGEGKPTAPEDPAGES